MIKVARTKWGRMLVPPKDLYVGRALIENKVFSPDEFRGWLPYLHKGATVLDIGANLGGHTFAFAKAVGKKGAVYAIEPQPALFHMLAGSVALTGCSWVWPRWCACGAEEGVVFIPPLDYNKANNFGGVELGAQTEGYPVACVPVDAWGMDDISFMKIDVEGMELDVLKGAEQTIARCRPVLVVEADRGPQFAPLLDWMLRAGYHPYLQTPSLGLQWPSVRSKNLLCLPKGMAAPDDPDVAAIPGIDLLVGN